MVINIVLMSIFAVWLIGGGAVWVILWGEGAFNNISLSKGMVVLLACGPIALSIYACLVFYKGLKRWLNEEEC